MKVRVESESESESESDSESEIESKSDGGRGGVCVTAVGAELMAGVMVDVVVCNSSGR